MNLGRFKDLCHDGSVVTSWSKKEVIDSNSHFYKTIVTEFALKQNSKESKCLKLNSHTQKRPEKSFSRFLCVNELQGSINMSENERAWLWRSEWVTAFLTKANYCCQFRVYC